MTNKFTAYQEAVERAKATLTVGPNDEVYLTSLDNPTKGTFAGRVGINSSGIAAMLVAQGTHRAATAEEVANWKAEQLQAKATIEAAAAHKEGKATNMDLTQFLAQFASVIAAASPAAQTLAKESEVPAIPVPPASGKKTSSQFPVPPAA
jgi:Rod binding domain-containing protein